MLTKIKNVLVGCVITGVVLMPLGTVNAASSSLDNVNKQITVEVTGGGLNLSLDGGLVFEGDLQKGNDTLEVSKTKAKDLTYTVDDRRGITDEWSIQTSFSDFNQTKGDKKLKLKQFKLSDGTKSSGGKAIVASGKPENVGTTKQGDVDIEKLRFDNSQYIEEANYESTLTTEVINSPDV